MLKESLKTEFNHLQNHLLDFVLKSKLFQNSVRAFSKSENCVACFCFWGDEVFLQEINDATFANLLSQCACSWAIHVDIQQRMFVLPLLVGDSINILEMPPMFFCGYFPAECVSVTQLFALLRPEVKVWQKEFAEFSIHDSKFNETKLKNLKVELNDKKAS